MAVLASLAAALGLAALSACSGSGESVEAARDEVVRHALDETTGRLSHALSHVRRGLAAVDASAELASDSLPRRFETLDRVLHAEGLHALQFEDAGGARAWAGVPQEPIDLPDPPAPWAASFQSGDVTYRSGPFTRTIVVSTTPARGGHATASVDLDDESQTTSPFITPLETRWARQLGVRAIRILPRETLDRPTPAGVRRAAVAEPGAAKPVFAVEVDVPTEEAVEASLHAKGRRLRGYVGLAGLAIATLAAFAAARRWVRAPLLRGLAFAALPLLVRHGLIVLRLRERFPSLEAPFRALHFGRMVWAGWLESPADFLLTSAALLLAAIPLARAIATISPPRAVAARAVSAVGGVAFVAAAAFLWLFFLESVTGASEVDLFAPGMLLPTLPSAMLLCGLVAATATAWILARVGLRLVVATCTTYGLPACRVSPVLVALVAGLLASAARTADVPWWAAFVVPLAAAVVGRLRTGAQRPGAPSRVLLVSVLSTALLFPVLWCASKNAEKPALEGRVAEFVRRPISTESFLHARVPSLLDNAEIRRALSAYGGAGSESDGIALQAWRALHFGLGSGDEGAVTVYDSDDRRIDRFGINVPPFHRLPDPKPDRASDEDPLTIAYAPSTYDHVGATIARLHVRSNDGAVVGTIAVMVPDALTVELAGLVPRIAARLPGEEDAGTLASRIDLALVRDGHVTHAGEAPAPSSLPSLSSLASLEEPAWLPPAEGADRPWYAAPAGPRGVILARTARRGFEAVLYAVARASLIGVGVGAVLALVVLVAGIRSFRPRLQDKILWSYFLVSVVPLVFLGYANWRDVLSRADDDFASRQRDIARTARRELEKDVRTDAELLRSRIPKYADDRGQDFMVFLRGDLLGTSLKSFADAEILPARLDAEVYRKTELEGQELVVRDEWVAGREVRVAYTPLRDDDAANTAVATLSVPLLFDTERAARRASESGSVLLAGYLVALLLVVVIGIYTARGLARRLSSLSDATRRVAGGDLDVALPRGGRDEVGALVDSFNVMTTDLKRLREREAAAERESAWRGMARQVAHEIKNPLTPMKLMLQQLQATARTDPRFAAEMIQPTAKVVLEQIEALSRIASDFSAFARFPPRSLADVDVNDLLRSVAILYAGGEDAQARIDTDLAKDVPSVRWDRDELRRVFVNLVANAVQSLDDAKGRVRVTVRSRRATMPASGADAVLVEVEDDGVGIPPGHLPRLFQPDFSTKSHGTGLGLAIVKRILADLGGEIRLDSRVGDGTTVSTWLPVAASAAAPADGRPPAADAAAADPSGREAAGS